METIQVQKNGDFFTCDIGISKEEWLEILQDDKTLEAYKETLLRFYYMPEHRGSCGTVSKVTGCNAQSLNSYITNFGKYVQKKLGKFIVKYPNGELCYWLVPMCEGLYLPKESEGTFEWKLRPELVEAIQDYLYWYLVEKYKDFRQKQPFRDVGQDWDELYKWELITASIGKSPIEIVQASIKYPNDTTKGGFTNLVYPTGYLKSMKYIVENHPIEIQKILTQLMDDSTPLSNRLADFKISMMKLLPSTGYNSKANDERTAATILTCINPDKYTFYKHDVMYDRFCKYLGEDMQKAGACYDHYLTLLTPLAKMADNDVKLQQIIKPMLEGQRQSKLLLAQDILWMLLKGEPKRLGYIYDLLFNMEKKEEMENENIYIKLLKANKNLILTGAPGTGKTYLAKEIAAQMLGIVDINDLETDKHYGFVQFHPSYDYTDFVEGLRPKNDKNGNLGFERKDGVFKGFCRQVLQFEIKQHTLTNQKKETYSSVSQHIIIPSDETKVLESTENKKVSIEEAYMNFVQDLNNSSITFQTPTGIDFKLIVDDSDNLVIDGGKYDRAKLSLSMVIGFYTGETTHSYFRSHCNAIINHLKAYYKLEDYYPKNEYKTRQLDSVTQCHTSRYEDNYVFIVDEINRGEVSKIFGELFFSIDPSYRGEVGKVNTQYQNLIEEGDVFYNGFFVPENVYIIGTMNDIDRSVESMDFAMRRRFAWKEVTAEESMQMLDGMPNEQALKNRMRNLNNAILKIQGLGKAYQIGAAYFKKIENYDGDFEKLWEYHLEGLLAEYLRGNQNADKQLEELKKAYDNEIVKHETKNSDNG